MTRVRIGKMGTKNLGLSPMGSSDPWSIYKGFKMDFAYSPFPGSQKTWTSPRGGHKMKAGDKGGSVQCAASEYDSIFGYTNSQIIPNINGNNTGKDGMFKGNGMNLHLKDHFNSDNSSHNFIYSFGSDNIGNPIAIAGLTFDATIVDKAYVLNGSTVENDGSDDRRRDFQFNRIYGCYLNPDNGTYFSLLFLPEGDNWASSNPGTSTKSKYVFRNSDANGTDMSTHYLRSKADSHFKRHNTNKISNITVVRAAADRVPQGYWFVGFDLSLWIGRKSDSNHTKIVNISNVRLHDERSVSYWHEQGRYYGDESKVGNHQTVIPELQNRSNSSRTSPWKIQTR